MQIKFFIGIIISLLFLYLALRNVNYGNLLVSLQQANYLYLIPAIVLLMLTMWFRALRWYYLLGSVKRVTILNVFSAVMIGFMANNMLPVRIGELVRAYTLGRKENISKSLSLATIVVERILDGFTLLTFLLVVLIFFPFPDWVKEAGLYSFLFFVFIVIFLICLKKFRDAVLKFFEYLVSPISQRLSEKIKELLISFITGFDILKNKRQIAFVLFYSFAIWTVYAALTLLVFMSFNFELPAYAPFLFIVILTFGVMIPSSPGYVGTYQFFCVTGLAFWGIKESDAMGFSLVFHASQYFPITIVGLFYLWRDNISFKEVRNIRKTTI